MTSSTPESGLPARAPDDSRNAQGGDENFSSVLLAAGAVVGVTALSLLAVALLMLCFKARENRQPPASREGGASTAPAQPRLEVSSGEELRKLRAEEDALIESYSWNRSTDGFRIPVERAMEIIAAEGLPAREKERDARHD